MALYYGGPKDFPGAAVGVLKKVQNDWVNSLTVLAQGKNTPRCSRFPSGIDDHCGKWGDYLNVRSSSNDRNEWYVAVASEQDTDPKGLPKVALSFASFFTPKAVSSELHPVRLTPA